MDNIWKVPHQDWENIDPKIAEFILAEGKEYLKDIWDVYEKTTQRSLIIITILITGLSAIIGFVWNRTVQNDYDKFFVVLIVIGIVVIIFLQVSVILPSKMLYQGREPKQVAVEGMLYNKLDDDRKYLAFLLNEISNVQFKIDCNYGIVRKRMSQLWTSWISLAVLFILTLIWLIIR